MATASDVAAYRSAVDDLTTLAVNDLNNALVALQGSSPVVVRNTLIEAFPELIGPYITAAGELTATWYEDLRRSALGGTMYATAGGPMKTAQAEALVRWGVRPLFGQGDSTPLSLIGGGVQRMIAGAGRDTIDLNARQDVATTSWSRVARPGACAFCKMLAGRGAVYRSAEAAGLAIGRGVDPSEAFNADGSRKRGGIGAGVKARGSQALGKKFHDWCRCVSEPTFYTIEVRPRTVRGFTRDERVLVPINPHVPEPRPVAAPARTTAQSATVTNLVPEEKFVKSLLLKLDSGELSVTQLQAVAKTATPLGKMNAKVAIQRFEAKAAELKVATASRKVAPATGGRTLPSLASEALNALLPKRGGWTTKTREATLKALNATPQGKSIAKTLKSFQFGGSSAIPRLRTDIEKYLSGEALTPGRKDSIENLLGAINSSNAGDRALYRGMAIPGDLETVLARYEVGDDLDISLASFTSDKPIGYGFASKGGQAGQRVKSRSTGVFVEWVGGNKTALPIENLSPSGVFSDEKEWIGAGRFRIVGKKTIKHKGEEMVSLQIEQVGSW